MTKCFVRLMAVVSIAAVLAACSNKPMQDSYDENIKEMNSTLLSGLQLNEERAAKAREVTLPPSVSDAMMPSAQVSEKSEPSAQLLDISVNNVPAQTFFKGLASDSGYSLVVSPDIKGEITLELKQVSLRQVLQSLRELYGYRSQRTAYGYNIYPKQLETRIFVIDKLSLTRTGESQIKLNSGGSDLTTSSENSSSDVTPDSSSTSITTTQNDTFWTDLTTTLTGLVQSNNTDGGTPSVNVTAETGLVVVKAYPEEMDLVERYIVRTQAILSREVIIEAQILDVELKKQYSAGIDWAALTSSGATTTSDILTPESGLLGNVYKLSMSGDNGNFNYAIQLLSSQGKVSVMSKPRVSAINNQNAVIKVGDDEYFVTSVSSEVTTGSDGSDDTTTSTIGLSAFFSGISLEITPQITADQYVNLRIHPSLSRVRSDNKVITVDDKVSELPLAKSQVRETDTVVRASNGQVIIIGGLMETNIGLNESGLPVGTQYADEGTFLKDRKNFGSKNELIILMRAVIVENGVWRKELTQAAKDAYHKSNEEGFYQRES